MTTWTDVLAQEKQKEYFLRILQFLQQEQQAKKIIYPTQENIFNALKLTPYSEVKAVIIGQDPYHGPNQAHGLCFSVQKGVPNPPSLQNIYKELKADCGVVPPGHGCLEGWAKQGVLLLNAVLTVEAHKAQSHAHIGWQQFTDTVISNLNTHPHPIVFLLWGSYAQQKEQLIDKRHHILKAPHPSPLSAYRGFLGCQHFSKTNALLREMGLREINWQL